MKNILATHKRTIWGYEIWSQCNITYQNNCKYSALHISIGEEKPAVLLNAELPINSRTSFI